MEILSLESLGIDYDFPDEIRIFANEHKSPGSIPPNYKSVYDYIAILFYYHFVEKLENREIAELLNVAPNNLIQRMYNYGWHYSKDYDINKELREAELKKLFKKLEDAKRAIHTINFEEFDLYKKMKQCDYYQKMRKKTWQIGEFKNKEEYLKSIFYFTQISEEKWSSREMATVFNVRVNTMQLRLENLGISYTLEEALEHKKTKNAQNYGATVRAGKVTRMKALRASATSGSMTECNFRDELSLVIYDYFYEDFYEVIVGTNTVGIIDGKEIDIPVIVINNLQGTYVKIAIEYNGETYHQKEDTKKKKLLKKNDWIYYEVIEKNNDGSHRGIKYIKEKARNTAMELKEIVKKELCLDT